MDLLCVCEQTPNTPKCETCEYGVLSHINEDFKGTPRMEIPAWINHTPEDVQEDFCSL